MGAQPKLPALTGGKWQTYYSAGDPNVQGLCLFACNYGLCPTSACSTTEKPLVELTTSPFTPDTCTGGTSIRAINGKDITELCEFGCKHGWCESSTSTIEFRWYFFSLALGTTTDTLFQARTTFVAAPALAH
jgi:hypothetical protein